MPLCNEKSVGKVWIAISLLFVSVFPFDWLPFLPLYVRACMRAHRIKFITHSSSHEFLYRVIIVIMWNWTIGTALYCRQHHHILLAVCRTIILFLTVDKYIHWAVKIHLSEMRNCFWWPSTTTLIMLWRKHSQFFYSTFCYDKLSHHSCDIDLENPFVFVHLSYACTPSLFSLAPMAILML